MLVSVGDLVEEVLVRHDRDPVRGGDIHVRSARIRGGSAANVAAIDAELGGSPRFVGQVGDDHIGEALVADLHDRGVDPFVELSGRTGVIVTMIGTGGRSRMIDRAASARRSVLDPDCLSGATHLYVAAVAFTEDPFASAVDRLLGEAAEHRLAVTIGGPSSADLESLGAAAFIELCRTLEPENVVLNRREHRALELGAREPLPGAGATIITNGPKPTLAIWDGRAQAVEVPPIAKIRDRTGVGDGFIAGFLRSRATGADPVSACHAGHRVAARVLEHVGPTTGARP